MRHEQEEKNVKDAETKCGLTASILNQTYQYHDFHKDTQVQYQDELRPLPL